MKTMEEMAEILRPERLQASLTKPRRCDETVLRMHLNQRLYYYGQDEKDAGIAAALSHFAEHRSMDYAIKVGARAAMDFRS